MWLIGTNLNWADRMSASRCAFSTSPNGVPEQIPGTPPSPLCQRRVGPINQPTGRVSAIRVSWDRQTDPGRRIAGLAVRPTISPPSAQPGSNVTFGHCDELSHVAGFVVSSVRRFVVIDPRHGTSHPRARGLCRGSACRNLRERFPPSLCPGADSRPTDVRPVGPPGRSGSAGGAIRHSDE